MTGHRDGQRHIRSAQPRRVDDEVRAPARPQAHARVELGRPHPCRADDGTRRDGQFLAGERVAESRGLTRRLEALHAREHGCPVPSRRPATATTSRASSMGCPSQPRIAPRRSSRRTAGQAGGSPRRRSAPARAVPRPACRRIDAARRPARSPRRCSRPATDVRRVEREHLSDRPRQMGRDARKQQVPFRGALVGDAELPRGQIAQASVDELRAPAARAVCKIVTLHEHGTQSPARGIQGEACAVIPPPMTRTSMTGRRPDARARDARRSRSSAEEKGVRPTMRGVIAEPRGSRREPSSVPHASGRRPATPRRAAQTALPTAR